MTTDFDECGSATILYGQILLFLGLVREVLYTEGVDDVAEAAGAYCPLDEIAFPSGVFTRGVATIEFALVMVFLFPLLVCTLELSRWSTARQHLQDYAGTVAYDVASAPSTIPGSTLQELMERIGLLAPELVDPTKAA